MGKIPDLCIIITTTTTTTMTSQGTCIQQLLLQDIVMALGTHQGTKQTKALPHGAPIPVEEQEEHIFRDCVQVYTC